jgi:hypothetical protein
MLHKDYDRKFSDAEKIIGRKSQRAWPYWDSNSDPLDVQPVVSRYTDWAIPVPVLMSIYEI